jgi:hypothetical protein
MFVMHFVRPSNPSSVPIISISKQFESLVNKNIMYQKIGQAVQENTQCDWESRPKVIFTPKNHESCAYKGIKNKKEVVAFKPRFVIFLVMVFVQVP